MTPDAQVHSYLRAHLPQMLERLTEWVRIPSVAGVPERAHHLVRSANWLAAELRDLRFPTTAVWPGAEGPAVYGSWCESPGAPTVLVYSHHDVRAVKEQNWDQTAPFDPVLRDGRLYGRGASDAKGQVTAHLWGIRAHLAATGRTAPAVNVKFLVEGEEEAGSPGLAELLDEHARELAADVVIFSDTLLWRADHPGLCTGVRGMLGARLEVYGPYTDIHSGAVSGVAPNPALEMARVLAQLYDEHGRITLPGFYDRVPDIPAARRAELAALPFDEADWLARSHTRSIGGETGYTVLERLWERPALEVIALVAGDPVGVSRATIPSMAAMDLSIRTVTGQRVHEVAEQLRTWVAALARAMAAGFAVEEVGRMGNAGGGPAALLATALDAPVVFFGTGLVEDNWHDSDESVRTDLLTAGAATLAHLWQDLGDHGLGPTADAVRTERTTG
ncbi:M20/M25/M40 family metallo-hydrolase [Kocuria sp. KH4]